MTAIRTQPVELEPRATRRWTRGAGWAALNVGVGLVVVHVLAKPLLYMAVWAVTGGRWFLGPLPGWATATVWWAAISLLLAGPLLVGLGDLAERRARRARATSFIPVQRRREPDTALSRESAGRTAA